MVCELSPKKHFKNLLDHNTLSGQKRTIRGTILFFGNK